MPAVPRSQPLNLFRELAWDRVVQSWAGVAPLSLSLHSGKGVELWKAPSHLSLVLAKPEAYLPDAPRQPLRHLGGAQRGELFAGGRPASSNGSLRQ